MPRFRIKGLSNVCFEMGRRIQVLPSTWTLWKSLAMTVILESVCSDVMRREGETRLALMILWYLDSHEEKDEENLERRIIETMK